VVVNGERVVLGRLFRKELESGADATVEALMRPGPSTYRPNVDVLEMSHHMTERKLETALVTRSDGRLLGLVRRQEVNDAAATLGHHHQH
jgi:predicted transcriptional regulator